MDKCKKIDRQGGIMSLKQDLSNSLQELGKTPSCATYVKEIETLLKPINITNNMEAFGLMSAIAEDISGSLINNPHAKDFTKLYVATAKKIAPEISNKSSNKPAGRR